MRKNIIDIITVLVLLFWSFWIYTLSFGTPKMMEQWWYQREEKPRASYETLREDRERVATQDALSYNTAMRDQDTKLCESISSSTEKSRCRDMIVASLALKNQKIEDCDTITSTGMIAVCRDNIISLMAGTRWEKSSCDMISDENIRRQCSESIDTQSLARRSLSWSLDDVFCETLGWEVRDICRARIVRGDDREIYKKALTSKNRVSCDAIADSTMKSQCRDTLLFEEAVRESNPDLCKGISNPERASSCSSSLTARQDMISYQSIIAGGDISKCTLLTTEALSRQCHDVITIANVRSTQDRTLCDTLYNTGMISTCQKLIRVN